MIRSSPSAAYDDDFFAWTQEQAAALRAVSPQALGDRIDIEHVAEEIEDLGKRELREVTSFFRLLFEHLIKIHNFPGSLNVPHWRTEARVFRRSAADAFLPSMRQHLDLERAWRGGHGAAQDAVIDDGIKILASEDCPFVLQELLAENFDLDAALAKLAAAPRPDVA